MAAATWRDDQDRGDISKCWYQPCLDESLGELALRFALSEPITAALPPGDPGMFARALDFASRFEPLRQQERDELASAAEALNPIFKSER